MRRDVERILACGDAGDHARACRNDDGCAREVGIREIDAQHLEVRRFLCVSRYSVPPIKRRVGHFVVESGRRRQAGTPCASDATGAAYSATRAGCRCRRCRSTWSSRGGEHDRRRQWSNACPGDRRAEDGAIALGVAADAWT
jgi:hypothetical protein